MIKPNRSRSGLTFVELVLALSIFAMVLSTVAMLLSAGSDTFRDTSMDAALNGRTQLKGREIGHDYIVLRQALVRGSARTGAPVVLPTQQK